MKKLLFYLSILFYTGMYAQVGIGTTTPDPSSALDITSDNKGVLIPRLTTGQRTGISSPATGLLVYDTDTNGFWYHNSSEWIKLPALSQEGWLLEGNVGTDPDVNFIGTTDNTPLSFRINDIRVGHLDTEGNVFWGLESGTTNTTGKNNTANGNQALSRNTTANDNTANGANALYQNTTGSNNTATGAQALQSNISGVNNTANGQYALNFNTGSNNTANGRQALFNNTTGSSNTANGILALQKNTTGSLNTANGNKALRENLTGIRNTANGSDALSSNTTGSYNTATGYRALSSNTTKDYNTANGTDALSNNTTGESNTANGALSLYSNTTGMNNTANGRHSLYYNTEGMNNTANGRQALFRNTTGTTNTANGVLALQKNTVGSTNTANGSFALQENTSGNDNVAVGHRSLIENITGNNNTAIGTEADVASDGITNATAIGYETKVNASNKVRIGNTFVNAIEGAVAWSHPSDARFKYNVQNNVPGLEFITKLKPATYYFDNEKLAQFAKTGVINSSWADIEGKVLKTGFLAQEVEEVAREIGYDFDGINKPENDRDNYSLGYSQFVVPLVKAVQEQQQIMETQNEKINSLEAKNEDILVLIQANQAQIESISQSLEALLPEAN